MSYLITKYAYIRPTDWLSMTPLPEWDQKIEILNAVFDADSNYAAFIFGGDYTIDWGDGSNPENYSSGIQCEHNYNYSDLDDTSLCSRGYRQAKITVTPQEGSNLTLANFYARHSDIDFLSSNTFYTSILEVNMVGRYFESIKFYGGSSTTVNALLEKFNFVGINLLTNTSEMFATCDSLQSINSFDTSNVTDMSGMFGSCNALKRVPLLDTSSVTNMVQMFDSCCSLSVVPLFNTSSVTNMTQMFSGCYSLPNVPLFDTSSVTNMSGMFMGCDVLQFIPYFDTSSVTNMGAMFYGCNTLQRIPKLDVQNVISFSSVVNSMTHYAFDGTALKVGTLDSPLATIYYNDLWLGYNQLIDIFNNLGNLPELLTTSNWTSAGWTGDFVNGFTHTVGNTTALTNTLAAIPSRLYTIRITTTGRTAGSIGISFGGYSISGATSSYTLYPLTTNTNTLSITPTSDFNGTVKISIKFSRAISISNNPGQVYFQNKNYDTSSQTETFTGMYFSSNGSEMYMMGNTSSTVYQYSLSTAWDLSTATYSSKSFSVATQDGAATGLAFSTDGSKMYVAGEVSNTVYQYSLSTAWDLSTATYSSKSFSVATQEIDPYGLAFSTDGSKMYVAGYNSDTVYQYSLSTAWDLSTAAYSDKYYNTSSKDEVPTGLALSSDGYNLYFIGTNNKKIFQRVLVTPWDVSTENVSIATNKGWLVGI